MKMPQEEFQKLTNQYVEAEKEYHDALSEYFVAYWVGEKPKPAKVLTRDAIEKLKKLDEKRLEIKGRWYKAF